MSKLKSPFSLFLISVILIALLALFGPEEQSLGSNVRIVYLHGAWVLAAELAFLAAGVAGLIAHCYVTQIKYYSPFRGDFVQKIGDTLLVCRARSDGNHLLGDVPPAFAVGDAGQLERPFPRRAALSPRPDLCCDGRAACNLVSGSSTGIGSHRWGT
jgi:uncharacterized integral membrane protein